MKKHWAKIGLLASILFVFLAVLILTLPVSAAVTLVRFDIISASSSVIKCEWETATEYNNLGFFIVRGTSEEGAFSRISNFISAEGSAVNGSIYQFTDDSIQSEQIYYYKLETVDLNSKSEFFGPISNSSTPTSTSMATLSSSTATHTFTNTASPTSFTTPTRTATVKASSTVTITPSPNETSPFSFVTNTNTLTPTITLALIITAETAEIKRVTETTIPTEIEVKTATAAILPLPSPSAVAVVNQVGPAIRSVFVGFGIVLGGGLLGMAVLIFLSKKKSGSNA